MMTARVWLTWHDDIRTSATSSSSCTSPHLFFLSLSHNRDIRIRSYVALCRLSSLVCLGEDARALCQATLSILIHIFRSRYPPHEYRSSVLNLFLLYKQSRRPSSLLSFSLLNYTHLNHLSDLYRHRYTFLGCGQKTNGVYLDAI